MAFSIALSASHLSRYSLRGGGDTSKVEVVSEQFLSERRVTTGATVFGRLWAARTGRQRIRTIGATALAWLAHD